MIKNKHFPKNTFAYDLSNNSLYQNFEYIDYQTAVKIHKNSDEQDLILVKNFRLKLDKLNLIIKKQEIKPIFINQLMYDARKLGQLYPNQKIIKVDAQLENKGFSFR